jgi:indolepyruvate ferredoxin oxidoreductase beta subunit
MTNENKRFSILFCGTGGQGVLSASEVCGVVAMEAGYHVRKSEVHGMAQRGGSVESHLVFGQNIFSPLIEPGKADFLVSFDEGEAKRLRYYLKKDGVDFSRLLTEAKQLADKRFLNTFMLGALSSMLPIDAEYWMHAIETVVAKKIEENKKVFALGAEKGKSL